MLCETSLEVGLNCIVVFAALLGTGTASADEASDIAIRLKEMQWRAQSTAITIPSDQKPSRAKLLAKPRLRYSDPTRKIVDGTLWCYENNGRPVAFQKTETYSYPTRERKWLHCFASACEKKISAKWKRGESWTASKPGLTFKPLSRKAGSNSNRVRLAIEAKGLAREFKVRLRDDILDSEDQLRLMPKPIHEYGKANSKVVYGAVFGFATGTCPDSLLVLEARADEENASADVNKTTSAEWHYGWIQMTTGGLQATLSNEVIWSAPYRHVSKVRKFDTWLFFHDSPVFDR